MSRMAAIQAMVEHHTLVIDGSAFVRTGDKVFVNGHFYSDKPPMPSVLGALVYLPLYHLGIKLGRGHNLAYYLITLLTVKVLWLFSLAAFYAVLGMANVNDRTRLWLTAALGVASLHFSWSAVFNNHSMTASTLTIGLYFLLNAARSSRTGRNLFMAGLCLSFAGTSDVPMALFYTAFFIYVLANPTLRKSVVWYLVPITFTIVPAVTLNYWICGSILPVQVNKAYFDYPGSPWTTRLGALSGVAMNPPVFFLKYSFNALLGRRGFLLYNPLLFIALPCLVMEIRRRRMFWREAIVIAACSTCIVGYYLLYTNDHGGGSYSIRWFVPLLPLAFLFLYRFHENAGAGRLKLFLGLLCVSLIFSHIGLINPWSKSRISKISVVANVKELSRNVQRLSQQLADDDRTDADRQ